MHIFGREDGLLLQGGVEKDRTRTHLKDTDNWPFFDQGAADSGAVSDAGRIVVEEYGDIEVRLDYLATKLAFPTALCPQERQTSTAG